MINPIVTQYNGYRFRSRLEARWAVLLDAQSIRYEYEKEGFSLPSGSYLPDFWLPDVWCRSDPGTWLEIKGQPPTGEEHERCLDLCRASGAAVVLQEGLPDVLYPESQSRSWGYSPPGEGDMPMLLHACPRGHVKFEFPNAYYGCPCQDDSCRWEADVIKRAVVVAKSADFGRTPAIYDKGSIFVEPKPDEAWWQRFSQSEEARLLGLMGDG